MPEEWKDVAGYEGLYQISSFGNVKSLNYMHRGYSQNLVPKVNNHGRLWVELIKGGKRKPFLIHRLVAEAFIQNKNNLPEVNHKDEDVGNNCVENLEWCTRIYNIRYSYERHPERHKNKRTKRKNESRALLPIEQIDMEGNVVKRWPNSRSIFNSTGMSDWSISECCRGKRKKAYGYRWRYAI